MVIKDMESKKGSNTSLVFKISFKHPVKDEIMTFENILMGKRGEIVKR